MSFDFVRAWEQVQGEPLKLRMQMEQLVKAKVVFTLLEVVAHLADELDGPSSYEVKR